jgi:hypothetical protein
MTSFSGLRRPRREINKPLSSSADVKNEWRYTPNPLIRLYGAERGNFISLFTFYPIVHTGSEAQSNFYSVGKAALSPGFKRAECASEHSLLPHSHSYTALYLLKYRDKSS